MLLPSNPNGRSRDPFGPAKASAYVLGVAPPKLKLKLHAAIVMKPLRDVLHGGAYYVPRDLYESRTRRIICLGD